MLPVAGWARTGNPDDSGFPVRQWRIVAADRWGWRRNEIPDYDASSTAAWIAGGFLMAGNRNERRRAGVVRRSRDCGLPGECGAGGAIRGRDGVADRGTADHE